MGVKFYQHMGGQTFYTCRACGICFTNTDVRISTNFYARSGAAFLFSKVVNVEYGEVEERIMTTGSHVVRNAICKKCHKIVGWMYEFAYEKDQEYKEGTIILERSLITQRTGMKEI